MIVSLSDLKAHLNITLDTDDALLERKIAAAQDHVERLLGFRIEEEFGGEEQDDIPPSLEEAVLLVAAHWYEERQSILVGVNAQTLPHGLDAIVTEHRRWSWADDE